MNEKSVWKYVAIFGGMAVVATIVITGLAASYERGVSAGDDIGFRSGLAAGQNETTGDRSRVSAELIDEIFGEGRVEGRREIVDGLLVSVAQSGAVRIVRGDDTLVLVNAQASEDVDPTPDTLDPDATPQVTP